MHSFIAYIDESGDDGLAKFREPGNGGGASKWLTICACILRATNDLQAVNWRDEIRDGTGKQTKGRSIHFAKLNHGQKRFSCQILSEKPLRFTAALSYKCDIPDGIYTEKNQLYFYVARYVIERISWFCRDNRPRVREGDGRVKVVFSRRGGMSYDNFRLYLRHLKAEVETQVHWPVIDIDGINAHDHSRMAGLQLADCGARAISEAFEPDIFGNVEGQYLHALKDKIYNRRGNYLSYGLKLLPSANNINFTADQAANLRPFR